MPDEEHVAAAGGQRLRVEVAAAQRVDLLDLDPELVARDPGGVAGADLRARQAGVYLHPESRERRSRRPRLALSLVGQAPGGVVLRRVLGAAVTQEPDHVANLPRLRKRGSVASEAVDMIN